MRSVSCRSGIGVLVLASSLLAAPACDQGSDSASLVVVRISVPDFGQWEANRPIEFAFNQRIDFASVSGESIRIRTAGGVPAAGTFATLTIDANGDGEPEQTDERVIVFYPRCPLSDDLTDAGLDLGARYVVTLAGTDSGLDPAVLLRSQSGAVLLRTVVQAFETIADPASVLVDEKPGAPPLPLVRAPGASVGSGCHLELGADPSNLVFFEADQDLGRPPSGFLAPLNLLGDPASRVTFVIVFDQLVRPTAANLARLKLEYKAAPGAATGWIPLATRVELASNCRPDGAAVRLVPRGTFPPGGLVRARIEAGFEDLVGEATSVDSARFAITEVGSVAYTSLDPAGALAGELREEFEFGPESPLSGVDTGAVLDAAQAQWGDGELRANHELVHLPPELREFDWVVRRNHVVEFDTTASVVWGGPDGSRTIMQHTTGGFVQVRNLVIEPFAEIHVVGPNPMVLHASGTVELRGTIDASGRDADDLTARGTGPAAGGTGIGGGGDGASSTPGASLRGNNGSGAYGQGGGGGGGESAFAPQSLGDVARRAGGGGGGRFARDQGQLVAEPGEDGALEGTGAESGLSPARGGTPGAEVFTDGDPSNDFFGVGPILDPNGAVIGSRRGELRRVHAGSGGGNAGDSSASAGFPPSGFELLLEGGGGGGGGGGLVIRATGRIVFFPASRIVANGGEGGSRRGFTIIGAACGGSGSGGHVILESGTAIDFSGGNTAQTETRIEAVGGPPVVQLPSQSGAGGAGGPGVIQLHVPHPELPPGHPRSNLILPTGALDAPDPLAAVCSPRPHVLYPTPGSLSRAVSRWIPLGAAGEISAERAASTVALLFGGIATAPGEDEGRVRTSGGRVAELAPLLGPVSVLEPGVALLPDGASLALSGPVLAPLRASARPISPDVYLRTLALLAGFTLRLARAGAPKEHSDLTIAGARYDDAAAVLTLALGNLSGTLEQTVAELGGAAAVELALVPRFFRVFLDPYGTDVLPDSHSIRILFQGAEADRNGRPKTRNPLVDWTADVSAFGARAPGKLDFVRFQVEFGLDATRDGYDPAADPIALDFLRLPLRF